LKRRTKALNMENNFPLPQENQDELILFIGVGKNEVESGFGGKKKSSLYQSGEVEMSRRSSSISEKKARSSVFLGYRGGKQR